jgi:hypothetical protein
MEEYVNILRSGILIKGGGVFLSAKSPTAAGRQSGRLAARLPVLAVQGSMSRPKWREPKW